MAIEDILLLGSWWNNAGQLLMLGIVNIIIGFIAIQVSFVQKFLDLLNGLSMPQMAALNLITAGEIAAAGPPLPECPVNWAEAGLHF